METRMLLLPPPQEANYQFNLRPGPRVPLSHFSKKNFQRKKKGGMRCYIPTKHLPAACLYIHLYCGLLCSLICFVYDYDSLNKSFHSQLRLINMVPLPGTELGSNNTN